MDDLQARLDRAMADEYDRILVAVIQDAPVTPHLDRYAALVALRARYEAATAWLFGTVQRGRLRGLDAEAERLCGKIEGRGAEDTRPRDTSR